MFLSWFIPLSIVIVINALVSSILVAQHGYANALARVAFQGNVDHITPKFLGGTDKKENLQILCLSCHRHEDVYTGRWLPLMYKEKIKIRTLVKESGRIYFSYP